MSLARRIAIELRALYFRILIHTFDAFHVAIKNQNYTLRLNLKNFNYNVQRNVIQTALFSD